MGRNCKAAHFMAQPFLLEIEKKIARNLDILHLMSRPRSKRCRNCRLQRLQKSGRAPPRPTGTSRGEEVAKSEMKARRGSIVSWEAGTLVPPRIALHLRVMSAAYPFLGRCRKEASIFTFSSNVRVKLGAYHCGTLQTSVDSRKSDLVLHV